MDVDDDDNASNGTAMTNTAVASAPEANSGASGASTFNGTAPEDDSEAVITQQQQQQQESLSSTANAYSTFA